jgi:hypothetical protein
MIAALIAVICSLMLVSCTRDLSKSEAAKQIEDHFHAVAPKLIKSLKIEITEILSPDENNREVRFTPRLELEVARETQEQGKLGNEKQANEASSTVYSVYFQRSTKGWTLRKYGHGTGSLLNILRIERLAMDYEPLMETLIKLSSKIPGSMGNSKQLNENTILAIIAREKIVIPNSVLWGFRSSEFSLQSGVLWVRDSKNQKTICAQLSAFLRSQFTHRNFCGSAGRTGFCLRALEKVKY